MDQSESTQNDPENLLTSIHDAYTLAATPDTHAEVEELMIKQFLDTLAEIAMAVASRKTQENHQ